MDFTYLDYFNYYLKEFCNEIVAIFPDFQPGIVSNYRELLEAKQSKNDQYVKWFVSRVNDHMDAICKRDSALFIAPGEHASLVFVEGVDMYKLWSSSFNTTNVQASVWKYLQLLTLLGRRVIPNNTEIKELLGQIGGEVYVPAKVEKTLQGKPDDLDDAGNKPDMLGLGGLASLAGMMGIGNGEMPDLSGIVKTIGEQLGNLDMSGLVSEMEQAQSETVAELEGANSSYNTESTPSEGTPDAAAKPPVTGKLFEELAKDMAETFDFEQLKNEGPPPENVGEAFSKFMSGGNAAKLMGLVTKFSNKMQQDINTGKLNQADLLKETMGMFGNMGSKSAMKKQAQQMAAENPAMVEELRRQQNQAAHGKTAARLKAKLEARQQQQQQSPQ